MTSFWTANGNMPEGDGQGIPTTTHVHDMARTQPLHEPPLEKRTTQECVEAELKLITKTAFYTTLVHPFNFAQVLMQIGYEPFPARLGKDIFGRSAYYLPSVFDYIQHIKKQTGFKGLFLGIGPTIAVAVVGVYTYRAAERLVKYIYDEQYIGRPAEFEIKRFGFLESAEQGASPFNALRFEPKETVGVTYGAANFAEDLIKEITIVSIASAAIWPLQVIAFRTMAQFVGGETVYDGLIGSIQEIANTEGISGFFKGLFPMLYSYVSITTVTYVAVFAYASYNTINPINLRLVAAAAGAVANSYFYPLKLTARLFAISGARIAAARPPKLPSFSGWRDFHNFLVLSGEGKRGSSMIFRKVSVKPTGSLALERAPAAAVYRAHSEQGEDWTRKYTSTQLLARHSTGLRFSL